MIPYGLHQINQQDIDAVVEVLQSDFLTQGPILPQFERQIAQATQSQYCIAVNSATSALHLACLALNLGKDDVVWTSPISFVASANCALYCGAQIDFVDIDPDTYNLSAVALSKKLQYNKQHNLPLPKIVIVVHLAGQPCDMQAIYELSQQFHFAIIEDASHAIGAQYHAQKVGSCQYSDVSVFSFHPVKIITTGEGGALTTNSEELYQKINLLRSHGITRDESLMHEASHGPWYYQQIALGFNYRMTEIQAALGLSQLTRLDDFIQQRRALAQRYLQKLKDLPLKLPVEMANTQSAYHLFIIRLELDNIPLTHRQVFEWLRENGIGVNLHYIPIHTQPYYQDLGFQIGQFPCAENYYQQAMSIPLFHGMSQQQQDKVISSLTKILSGTI